MTILLRSIRATLSPASLISEEPLPDALRRLSIRILFVSKFGGGLALVLFTPR
jgi:hypothetical protein